ncbi:hypothetical protein N8940_00135 [Sphingomonadaceae bacterium]|nr:hypothetical protein [Sphingomonadaceae bacterium]
MFRFIGLLAFLAVVIVVGAVLFSLGLVLVRFAFRLLAALGVALLTALVLSEVQAEPWIAIAGAALTGAGVFVWSRPKRLGPEPKADKVAIDPDKDVASTPEEVELAEAWYEARKLAPRQSRKILTARVHCDDFLRYFSGQEAPDAEARKLSTLIHRHVPGAVANARNSRVIRKSRASDEAAAAMVAQLEKLGARADDYLNQLQSEEFDRLEIRSKHLDSRLG